MRTNRDLYLFVRSLRTGRSLESYLGALWRLAVERRALDLLPLPIFAGLLGAAVSGDAPAWDPAWASAPRLETQGFARFERVVRAQIVDLHEMEAAGVLRDPQRYYGVDAPRGMRWYNFDPETFLECAVAGSFGGFRESDGGRVLLPGDTLPPEEADLTLDPVSWSEFADFLRAGQLYE